MFGALIRAAERWRGLPVLRIRNPPTHRRPNRTRRGMRQHRSVLSRGVPTQLFQQFSALTVVDSVSV